MPTIIITGGHGGIGFECAKQLAAGGRLNILLAGRNMERMEPAAQQLRTTYRVKVDTIQLDTSSLASMSGAAARCRDR
ncbi:MAG TPA: SDR family NAD(P)-dependent oxidoreductase [Chthoniobacterales bacterium]